jgi:signal transduction histidine kinase
LVASQQVVEATQYKPRFLAAARHDPSPPIHALGLFGAQLRSHITSSDGNRLVDRIDDAATGMNELLNALRDVTLRAMVSRSSRARAHGGRTHVPWHRVNW